MKIGRLCLAGIFCFFVVGWGTSCGPDEFERTRKRKVRVDTLTNNMIIELRPELDSLCELRKKGLVQHAIDSIMPIRLKEIEEMLEN